MKTLTVKQVRSVGVILGVMAVVISAYGAQPRCSFARPSTQSALNRAMLADDGQESHGGKGHRAVTAHLA